MKTRGDAAVIEYTNKFDRLSAPDMAALELSADVLGAALEGLEPDRPVRFGPWRSAPIPSLHARVLISDTNLRPRPRSCQAARP